MVTALSQPSSHLRKQVSNWFAVTGWAGKAFIRH